MFANLLNLISRRQPIDCETAFVDSVKVPVRGERNPRVVRLIWICWALIAIKCAAVYWAAHRYHVPFDPLWIIGPTIVFAALCTAIYFGRE